MWPWAHAAFGYLLYASYLRWASEPVPRGNAVILLAVGTQLPDLVDKPLAWYLHVLPYGRSLAHSLLVAVPLILLASWYADRRGHRRLASAFAIGYLSHLLGDGLGALLSGEWADLGYLAWPLVAPPDHEVEGLLAHLADIRGSPLFLFGLLLTAAAFALWTRHGRPGLGELRRLAARPTG